MDSAHSTLRGGFGAAEPVLSAIALGRAAIRRKIAIRIIDDLRPARTGKLFEPMVALLRLTLTWLLNANLSCDGQRVAIRPAGI